jgi:prepilin peptidase CpaA
MQIATLAALAAFPILMIAAALCDVATMTIPNRISLLLIPAFFAAALLARLSPAAIAWHVGVGVAALLVMAGCFAMGWLGGGDAKLLAAASLWVGPGAAVPFVFDTAVAGGGLALVLLLARANPWTIWLYERGPEWLRRLLTPKGAIPYGVAIAAGALCAFPASGLVAA